MQTIRIFVVALSMMSLGTPGVADSWEVVEDWTDPFVGESVAAARTVNDDGFSLTVFRSEDGAVRAIYSLPVSSFDRLPKEGRALMIRPGDLKSYEIKVDRQPSEFGDDARTDGQAVRYLLWPGDEPSPMVGIFRHFLDSEELHARFFLDDGKTVDTSWSLSQSHPAIEQAVGIEADVDPDERNKAEAASDATVKAYKSCQASGFSSGCLQSLVECTPALDETKDVAAFETCMAQDTF